MTRLLVLTTTLLAVGACSAGPTADAGAGCVGVPANLTEYQCVGGGSLSCDDSLAQALAQNPADCGAAPDTLGDVAVLDCPALEGVRYLTGTPGDVVECFYPRDGGGPTGGIAWTDRGVLVAGTVSGGCSRHPAPSCTADGGVDAGQPVCVGVPASVTSYQCVEAVAPYTDNCLGSLEQTLAAHTADCDAGPGILGHVEVKDCPALQAAAWVYGPPGDTFECFYTRDGGVVTGFINFSDHGVVAGGTVEGDACTTLPAPSCRDGG